MRVRQVQELDIPDLPQRLHAARKQSDMSLLAICRKLGVSSTYWYKLERGETSTINYDMLEKIAQVVDLGFEISTSLSPNSLTFTSQENGMDFSRLNWIKVVTPPKDYAYHWAYSLDEITKAMAGGAFNQPGMDPAIHQAKNEFTVFPLGFKDQGAEKPECGDLIVLTQRAKITHVVAVLDEAPYENGGWWNRYVKIVWWQPHLDWHKDLPHRSEILEFDVSVQKSIPYELEAFQSFHEVWDEKGGLKACQEHVKRKLIDMTP
ncbi:helix-turn-helix domain-containing protein [[Limnothrix rosea] IAM M-220]|uniref:helix-turn-helix domain-containing protein n=1 Tax=[Limnothrix rosea] IAM M-220 TaxID=454133 RepID=UPI0009614DEA|nr:helix-turn-helix transcriptional regulator [[Limnothrix rosea] IAM M-220]OKH13766.1 hypothetical protein NIES208_14935 [[Limnothrix rosea] IAM M-220]